MSRPDPDTRNLGLEIRFHILEPRNEHLELGAKGQSPEPSLVQNLLLVGTRWLQTQGACAYLVTRWTLPVGVAQETRGLA